MELRHTGSYNSSLALKKRCTTKRTKKKGSVILTKMVNYLMSDSYLYSHLLNSSSSSSESSAVTGNPFSSSPTRGLPMNNLAMKGSNIKLKKRIWEYLRSDSYLYSPLINARESPAALPSAPAPGRRLQFTQVSREILVNDISRIPLTEEIAHKAGHDREGGTKVINLDHDLRKETLKRRKVNGRAF